MDLALDVDNGKLGQPWGVLEGRLWCCRRKRSPACGSTFRYQAAACWDGTLLAGVTWALHETDRATWQGGSKCQSHASPRSALRRRSDSRTQSSRESTGQLSRSGM